jgi:hypothetical protein
MTSLGWYRTLLKTSRVAFKGDSLALSKSREELRTRFEQSRFVTDKAQLEELFEVCSDANTFLRQNVVQATKTSRGNWAVDLKDPNVPHGHGEGTHIDFEAHHPSEVLNNKSSLSQPLNITPATKVKV